MSIERYTPTGPDHIKYEVTIEDPKVFSRPWQHEHGSLPSDGAES